MRQRQEMLCACVLCRRMLRAPLAFIMSGF